MASIGKFMLSGVTGVQEMTLALANLNVDFSVIRYEANPEFREVGNRLSKRRKMEAEDGRIHSTARHLGALFKDVIPPVDALCAHYGLRASEIAKNPKVNPQGSAADGPLADHIGLDATTLWAVATSGPGSVQIHLLACMLARNWSGAQAVSIWSELVAARKAELERCLNEDETFHPSYVTLTRIHIGLDELAEWDNSARAWLAAADQAYVCEQKKLMLIIENIGSGFRGLSTLYEDVLHNWKMAMIFMDRIVSGVAQSVEELPVLLGLASWHLYPNIAVVGFDDLKQVALMDALIPPAAIVTIGIKSSRNLSGGLSWTLPLGNLKYYGKPSVATGVLGLTSLRVPFSICILVGIGSLLSSWSVYSHDISKSLKYLLVLSERVTKEEATHSACDLSCRGKHWNFEPNEIEWIRTVAKVCTAYPQAKDKEQKEMFRYINLGRTRYRNFLTRHTTLGPAMGLHSIPTCLSLLDVSQQILTLRRFASRHPWSDACGSAVIYYRPTPASPGEFASLIPQKLSCDGHERVIHRRWLLPMRQVVSGKSSFNPLPGHESNVDLPTINHSWMATRAINLTATTGEPCGLLGTSTVCDFENQPLDEALFIKDPTSPDLIQWKQEETRNHPRTDDLMREAISQLLVDGEVSENAPNATVRTILAGIEICRIKIPYEGMSFRKFFCSSQVTLYIPTTGSSHPEGLAFPLDFLSETLENLPLDRPIIAEYLQDQKNDYEELESLSALHRASLIYKEMPTATVDINVASKPLSIAKWSAGKLSTRKDRAVRFACVAYFDSGALIDFGAHYFHNVMAISSKNWLYVSKALLNDPGQEPGGICCLLGNVGKPGMSLLVSPEKPELKEDFLEDLQMVNHDDFDGQIENNFVGTSLHMSMTGADEALNIGIQGARYVDVSRVEANVSILHRGEWFGDVDILSLFNRSWLGERMLSDGCDHSPEEIENRDAFGTITSIDSWAEMMNYLPNTSIIRAKGNWNARLALASVMKMRKDNAIIARDRVCWACIFDLAGKLNISPYEILLLC